MNAFAAAYVSVEKALFYTLTRKLVGNIGLRVWQLLRAPSVMQLHRRREALRGGTLPGPRAVPTWLWLWSSEGWFQPLVHDAVRGVLGLARRLDRSSRRLEGWLIGGRDEVQG